MRSFGLGWLALGAADRVPYASSSNVVDQPRTRGVPMLEGAALLGTHRLDANAYAWASQFT
ncbi:uncharacterized protein GLRG_08333 [Colletotrichum graminicola M1.001]|uniref:Uncharacterized protein n=1 Tax=Colletotrichum graminicola (strain M1.001 / M2 / FGSC 10212) TaxID=645133 RepID=E3QQQ1_COLGM|nr:uncharacterized protein GLRG_08333 [Colletotrichum graminicola M1.001]EFQ33189.1 hypothetical protein GLRG_08333 [Colletotrichum graminicola M1.001]